MILSANSVRFSSAVQCSAADSMWQESEEAHDEGDEADEGSEEDGILIIHKCVCVCVILPVLQHCQQAMTEMQVETGSDSDAATSSQL